MTSNKSDLKPEYYGGVWDIISGSNQMQMKSGEVEFDIEKLPVKVARQLERYARSKLTPLKKGSKKPQPKKNPLAFHKEDLAPRTYASQTYAVVLLLTIRDRLPTLPQGQNNHIFQFFLQTRFQSLYLQEMKRSFQGLLQKTQSHPHSFLV